MLTRKEAIEFCLTFPGAYEDYPFDDMNWTVMRRKDTKHGFCWIYEHNGQLCMNLKNTPDWGELRRRIYPSVLPAYRMNKEHWSTVLLDGTVPEEELEAMIAESYRLCGKPKRSGPAKTDAAPSRKKGGQPE